MTCRETIERLDDYVDGRLTTAERERVRRHLDGCLACSRELTALRRLQGRAADLPGLEPRCDLWPAVRRRIAPTTTDAAERPEAPSRPWRAGWLLAAAAALAVAVALPRFVGHSPSPQAPTAADGTPRLLLIETLRERRDELPAESVAAFESNLEILDSAIREIEGALELAPESRRLRLLLAERRQQEAELLKMLARA